MRSNLVQIVENVIQPTGTTEPWVSLGMEMRGRGSYSFRVEPRNWRFNYRAVAWIVSLNGRPCCRSSFSLYRIRVAFERRVKRLRACFIIRKIERTEGEWKPAFFWPRRNFIPKWTGVRATRLCSTRAFVYGENLMARVEHDSKR